jgi:hypothetical protein
VVIAASRATLLGGTLATRPWIHADGSMCSGGADCFVWSGASSDGTTYAGRTCDDWRSSSGGGVGQGGYTDYLDHRWMSDCEFCACFEVGVVAQV